MNKKIPQHIAVIMDGNGRWAQARGLTRIEGHKAGLESVKTMIAFCLENKVQCLSLFAFSSENWLRPVQEVQFLMQLFLDALRQQPSDLHARGIRLHFLGDRAPLSQELQQYMREAEALTKENERLSLNILVNYGGKWDLLQAAKKLAQAHATGQLDLDEVDELFFNRYLDTADLPEPDLFIRTSGELRISNFFLWQLAYTELYFTEVHWPDFGQSEMQLALDAFQGRTRRFGTLTLT